MVANKEVDKLEVLSHVMILPFVMVLAHVMMLPCVMVLANFLM